MTQTQDEQNVQASGSQTQQSTNPVANEQDVLASDNQAEDIVMTEETSSKEHTIDYEIGESAVSSLINNGSAVISSWVEKIKWFWKAGVEWVQNVASQWVESVKDTLAQWWDMLKETSQNAIEWIKNVWQDIKEWFWNIISWASSGGWVLESWKAVVQWTVSTATNVVWNAATNVMETWTSVVSWAVWAVSNVATSATNVVKDSVNNIAWAVLPWQAAQGVANFNEKVSQWAQDLWAKAKETIQETGEKAKWFFSWLWDNFKSWFSSNDAKKVMDEINAPLETDVQAQQQATPQVQQPVAPQVQQPATPQVEQPAAPQVQQPAEVQLWDTQQPTNPTA